MQSPTLPDSSLVNKAPSSINLSPTIPKLPKQKNSVQSIPSSLGAQQLIERERMETLGFIHVKTSTNKTKKMQLFQHSDIRFDCNTCTRAGRRCQFRVFQPAEETFPPQIALDQERLCGPYLPKGCDHCGGSNINCTRRASAIGLLIYAYDGSLVFKDKEGKEISWEIVTDQMIQARQARINAQRKKTLLLKVKHPLPRVVVKTSGKKRVRRNQTTSLSLRSGEKSLTRKKAGHGSSDIAVESMVTDKRGSFNDGFSSNWNHQHPYPTHLNRSISLSLSPLSSRSTSPQPIETTDISSFNPARNDVLQPLSNASFPPAGPCNMRMDTSIDESVENHRRALQHYSQAFTGSVNQVLFELTQARLGQAYAERQNHQLKIRCDDLEKERQRLEGEYERLNEENYRLRQTSMEGIVDL
ncbi:hypothetical protein M231_06003 [Tremella mesenterica]|uniref:Uncharacterized protein n=1 Tax=Tremella mesenterica TaxID=5217 RepID=A0A4Q1BGK4_TREME|nr:hypothetical protein M231_06003 [Tremella mesenterica]